jgi:hypothetical protein
MAKTIKRACKLSDDVMLERATVFYSGLESELPDFTLRFPWLDATWLDGFKNAIEVADAFPKDESLKLDIKVMTSDVRSAMQQGYAALQALAGYARLAWPNDLARQRGFGQDGWKKAYANSLKMQESLILAYDTANSAEMKPALLDKGYQQADIDALATLSELIQLNNGKQESAKQDRKVMLRDRITLVNTVWAQMQTISTCASIVWAADSERMARYNLYPQGYFKAKKSRNEP